MERFNGRIGAGVLGGLAAVYMVAALVTGRSARAEVPPDLTPRPADLALDVWKAAALLVGEGAAVVDLRPLDAFQGYHVPGARSLPAGGAAEVAALARSWPVLVYAGKDEVAHKVVAEVRAAEPQARVYYLADGARAWYLAFGLPVPLFAEASPPDGYAEAMAKLGGYLAEPEPSARAAAAAALQTLARINYQPTLLKSGRKTAAAGGARKKIGGGCG